MVIAESAAVLLERKKRQLPQFGPDPTDEQLLDAVMDSPIAREVEAIEGKFAPIAAARRRKREQDDQARRTVSMQQHQGARSQALQTPLEDTGQIQRTFEPLTAENRLASLTEQRRQREAALTSPQPSPPPASPQLQARIAIGAPPAPPTPPPSRPTRPPRGQSAQEQRLTRTRLLGSLGLSAEEQTFLNRPDLPSSLQNLFQGPNPEADVAMFRDLRVFFGQDAATLAAEQRAREQEETSVQQEREETAATEVALESPIRTLLLSNPVRLLDLTPTQMQTAAALLRDPEVNTTLRQHFGAQLDAIFRDRGITIPTAAPGIGEAAINVGGRILEAIGALETPTNVGAGILRDPIGFAAELTGAERGTGFLSPEAIGTAVERAEEVGQSETPLKLRTPLGELDIGKEVARGIADPLNIVPIIGFGPDILRGARVLIDDVATGVRLALPEGELVIAGATGVRRVATEQAGVAAERARTLFRDVRGELSLGGPFGRREPIEAIKVRNTNLKSLQLFLEQIGIVDHCIYI